MKDIFKAWIEFFEEIISTKLVRLICKVLAIVVFMCFIWPHAKSTYFYVRDRGSIEARVSGVEKRLQFIEDNIYNSMSNCVELDENITLITPE